ncbi:hypothetical protein CKAN_00159500 [Cinnamomum micranthum f. kanehirae]|uniref:Uncharacterized protein n=1 Tax=Cinnamomum micranthum f. kanehirae TaxID=337451 RepID=A0A443N469_9MAGN|nr:hypothetical protein CKAN_00159500 [Cinnamomum micranthum f. kanehirae]
MADGRSKANQDHITYGPRIVVLTKKVGSLERAIRSNGSATKNKRVNSLNQSPLLVLEMRRTWRISCGLWSSIYLLPMFPHKRELRSPTCICLVMQNFGGEQGWVMT